MAYTEDDYDVTALGDLPDEDEDDYLERDDDEDDNTCPECRGTGIGQYGDINTSKCPRCNGTGVRREEDEDQGARADEAYERRRDAQDELELARE